eukprot:jgi/Ulvmu1/3904/UM018_0126.1
MFLINLQSDVHRGQAPASADLDALLSTTSTIVIGRDTGSDIQLDSEDMPAMVSRIHAEISMRATELRVLDRGSMNGTYVNGARIEANVWQHIKQGDVISFGGTAEVGKDGRAIPNPFLYVVAQHPPMHAQNSLGSAIDLTSPDALEDDDLQPQQTLIQTGENRAKTKLDKAQLKMCAGVAQSLSSAPQQGCEFECPICTDILCVPVSLVPCGHSYCADCILKAFQTQRRGRLVCPLCRSTPTHPPLRVPLLSDALSSAVAALPAAEKERQSERAATGVAAQASVMESLNAMITPATASPQRLRQHLAARMIRMHRFGAGANTDLREPQEGDAAGSPGGQVRGAGMRAAADAGVAPQPQPPPPPRHGLPVEARPGQRESRRDRRVMARGAVRQATGAGSSSRGHRRGAEVAARVVRAGRYRGAGEINHVDRDIDVDVRVGQGLARQGSDNVIRDVVAALGQWPDQLGAVGW